MRLRTTATVVMALAVAMAGCSDDTSTEPEGGTTTSAPAQVTTPESGASDGDAGLQALQERLAAEGLDESLATFGVEWCRHQDLAMLSREVGNMELAEQVSAAASETAC